MDMWYANVIQLGWILYSFQWPSFRIYRCEKFWRPWLNLWGIWNYLCQSYCEAGCYVLCNNCRQFFLKIKKKNICKAVYSYHCDHMQGVQVFVYVPTGASLNPSYHCRGVSLVGGVLILAGVTRNSLHHACSFMSTSAFRCKTHIVM